jgi:TolB-like protein
VVGTVAYMSPEQAQGQPVDARSDIFSFGLVLYEVLSGKRAFTGETPFATMSAIVRDEPLPLNAPSPVMGIVKRCLAKQVGERYQTAGGLRSALVGAEHFQSPLPSIAVLPFANMSGDKENEYFSDGLAEEILSALAQVPGLTVIARTSAFAFKGQNTDIRGIAETLGVANILEGSVRKAGNQMIKSKANVTMRITDGTQPTSI